MSEKKGAREFWIDNDMREIFLKKPHHTHSPNPIHVIEHAAITELQEQVKALQQERAMSEPIDDKMFCKDDIVLLLKDKITKLEAENKTLKEEHECDKMLIRAETKMNAKYAEENERYKRALEKMLVNCRETSCPYPCRAMCSNEAHKLAREALAKIGDNSSRKDGENV